MEEVAKDRNVFLVLKTKNVCSLKYFNFLFTIASTLVHNRRRLCAGAYKDCALFSLCKVQRLDPWARCPSIMNTNIR